MLNGNKHYFNMKGKSSEQAIQELASKSFLREWCFPNPIGPDGKEICDLLVWYDTILVIIQVKDIKFGSHEERYIKKAIDAPAKQLLGAERYLKGADNILPLKNANGVKRPFDSKAIAMIFRLVVSVGDGKVPFHSIRMKSGRAIHVFDRDFAIVINELDTIADFCKYLVDKESLVSSQGVSVLYEREADLLADYVYHSKSFSHVAGLNSVVYENGLWEKLSASITFQEKRKADRNSYLWDHLIEYACTEPVYGQQEIAREMSRLNRFERRMASDNLIDAKLLCDKSGRELRRICPTEDTIYVYLFKFANCPRSNRTIELQAICFVISTMNQNIPRVIGIATESSVRRNETYDFVLIKSPVWTDEELQQAADLRKEYGIMQSPTASVAKFNEFPSDNEGK